MHLQLTYEQPVIEVTYGIPAVKVKLDEANNYVINGDATVHRDLYCTPTYFKEDYVVKPLYI